MRKTALSLIITMSLVLTSGMGSRLDAQSRLQQTLQQFTASAVKTEITVWLPQRAETGLQNPPLADAEPPEGWNQTTRRVSADGQAFIIKVLRSASPENALEIYTANRKDAVSRGGGAALTMSANLPANPAKLSETGGNLLAALGADRIVQEITDLRLYSGAAELEGWGSAIQAGNDEINLQIILRPDDKSDYTHLYLAAPVLITDL